MPGKESRSKQRANHFLAFAQKQKAVTTSGRNPAMVCDSAGDSGSPGIFASDSDSSYNSPGFQARRLATSLECGQGRVPVTTANLLASSSASSWSAGVGNGHMASVSDLLRSESTESHAAPELGNKESAQNAGFMSGSKPLHRRGSDASAGDVEGNDGELGSASSGLNGLLDTSGSMPTSESRCQGIDF